MIRREASTTAQPSFTGWLGAESRAAIVAGLSGAVAGVVVAGIGGRLAMRASMLLARGPVEGRLTEGGNVIGRFTMEGTIGLILFGGLLTGLIAAVYWYAVRPLVRRLPGGQLLAAMAAAVALGGFLIIQPDNRDFSILTPAGPQVALFLFLVAITGAAIAWLDRQLERMLPRRPGPPMSISR